MDIRDFNKIIVVSLCDRFTDSVANLLSQNLDMMFCNTRDLVEYELIDQKIIQEKCSKEYLKKSERAVMKHIASFVNVVVSINFDYLIHNIDILKIGGLIVFLKLPKNYVKENSNVVDLIDYENRSQELQKVSHAMINLRKTEPNFVCSKIMEVLGGIL